MVPAVVGDHAHADVLAPVPAGQHERLHVADLRRSAPTEPSPVLLPVHRARARPHLELPHPRRVELVVGQGHRRHRRLLGQLHGEPLAVLSGARGEVVRVHVLLERRAGALGLRVGAHHASAVGVARVVVLPHKHLAIRGGRRGDPRVLLGFSLGLRRSLGLRLRLCLRARFRRIHRLCRRRLFSYTGVLIFPILLRRSPGFIHGLGVHRLGVVLGLLPFQLVVSGVRRRLMVNP